MDLNGCAWLFTGICICLQQNELERTLRFSCVMHKGELRYRNNAHEVFNSAHRHLVIKACNMMDMAESFSVVLSGQCTSVGFT